MKKLFQKTEIKKITLQEVPEPPILENVEKEVGWWFEMPVKETPKEETNIKVSSIETPKATKIEDAVWKTSKPIGKPIITGSNGNIGYATGIDMPYGMYKSRRNDNVAFGYEALKNPANEVPLNNDPVPLHENPVEDAYRRGTINQEDFYRLSREYYTRGLSSSQDKKQEELHKEKKQEEIPVNNEEEILVNFNELADCLTIEKLKEIHGEYNEESMLEEYTELLEKYKKIVLKNGRNKNN